MAEVTGTNVRFIRKSEIFWVEHQPWLEEQGYRLRPRYHPDWVPSWIQDPSKVIYKCEDGLTLPTGATIVDAIHISDGAHVMLKAVPQDRCPEEISIGRFFVSDPIASDPANHCNAFRTTLHVPDDPNIQILVMPLLRSVLYPRFETIGEIVSFFTQVFEGLQFMHKHLIAHRDCAMQNIMMDGEPLFSEPWHPVVNYKSWDLSRYLRSYTRTERPVKYYLVDFGISKRYTHEQCPPAELIHFGVDRTVPEFQGVPEDIINPFPNPFQTDVYYIGNMVRMYFLKNRVDGLHFVEPLINDMVQDDPAKRPTMDEVVRGFDDICARLSTSQLRGRAHKRKTLPIVVFFRSFGYWARRIRFTIARVPAVPCRPNPRLTMSPPDSLSDRLPGDLLPSERFFRDHQVWLEERGYMLRSRYKPDWVPSWLAKGDFYIDAFDGYAVSGTAQDSNKPRELEIASLVSSSPLKEDPRNHCVPILEVLDVPDVEDCSIIVMPLLRRFGSPRFDTFGETIDFFDQAFEGLKFMHDNNVAHRDCTFNNIMMDASQMFPNGYHPIEINRNRNFSGKAKFYTRTQRPPRYYWIDFGLSRKYTTRNPPPLEPPIRGGDKSVPEFELAEPCDPFPIDIYYLGNFIRGNFVEVSRLL
ncbi:hypothetical protein C8R46DRAFT_904157 [Mycena filopes]|nr:hypothetical protein C8R46DRAFT_904157 [Mycena filopes]